MAVEPCTSKGFPTGGELASLLGIDLDRANDLAEVAEAVVSEYAPDAPGAIKGEAARRVAGYLRDRKPGIRRESVAVGDYTRSATFEMSTGALRASGAMGLLSRWKVRRAGVI